MTEHNLRQRVAPTEGAWLVCGCIASRRERFRLLQISLRHGVGWCSWPGRGDNILPPRPMQTLCVQRLCCCSGCANPANWILQRVAGCTAESFLHCSTLKMTAIKDLLKLWKKGLRSLLLCGHHSACVWRCAPGWRCSYPSWVRSDLFYLFAASPWRTLTATNAAIVAYQQSRFHLHLAASPDRQPCKPRIRYTRDSYISL